MNSLKALLLASIFFYSNISLSSNVDKLILPDGFKATLFAKDIEAPRQMAEGKKYIFVGGIKGKVYALQKDGVNGNAVLNKIVIASGLNNSRGIALKNGDLYFSEVDKIWVIKNIEELLDENIDTELVKTLFNNDLPSESWHGGKWIMFGPDGQLYANVGAPCNVCLDGINKNPVYASIIKLNDENKWNTVARGVRNSVGFDWHPQTNKMYFGDNGRAVSYTHLRAHET